MVMHGYNGNAVIDGAAAGDAVATISGGSIDQELWLWMFGYQRL
jgi:hypothetical protein